MSQTEIRICGHFKLGKKIRSITQVQHYQAKNIQSDQNVLIKIEETKYRHPQLLYEGKILQNLQGGIGIPSMFWYKKKKRRQIKKKIRCGQEGDNNFLVMEELGESLEQLFQNCNRKFSLKTVLMIGVQILKSIEYMHYKSYINREINSQNFHLGIQLQNINKIFQLNFGSAKKYKDSQTHEHIPFREKKPLIGASRFASINAHLGYELSRRDDIESLAYMLIYFLKGSLPWKGLKMTNKQAKFQKVKEIKTKQSIQELCKGCPKSIELFLEYSRSLGFEDKPDYTYLKGILLETFHNQGFIFDFIYDWVLLPLNKIENLEKLS
ncbi:hypothetical protein IMG5_097570, partial [Ichthyophthirius multifiliis]